MTHRMSHDGVAGTAPAVGRLVSRVAPWVLDGVGTCAGSAWPRYGWFRGPSRLIRTTPSRRCGPYQVLPSGLVGSVAAMLPLLEVAFGLLVSASLARSGWATPAVR